MGRLAATDGEATEAVGLRGVLAVWQARQVLALPAPSPPGWCEIPALLEVHVPSVTTCAVMVGRGRL